MEIIKSIKEIQQYCSDLRAEGKTVGLVPTMGYFHEGHLELMRCAKKKGHEVVVSLFVNPTQFGQNEDLDSYPKNLERDFSLAKEVGVRSIFLPDNAQMYPNGYKTYVEVRDYSSVLCGGNRPVHFIGVATIVLKLFHIIQPDEAFFGQKDGQQVLVVKKMLADLNLNIPITAVPTVREDDGLAMSSRNAYLNPQERKAAPILYRTLKEIERRIINGERRVDLLLEVGQKMVATEMLADLHYVEIRRTEDLELVDEIKGEVMVAIAVKIGVARLIDNIVVSVEE